MLDLVSRRKLFYLVTALLVVPGLLSPLLPGGLRPGIDFISSTIMTIRFDRPVAPGDVRQAFADGGHPEAVVQGAGDDTHIVRTRPLEQAREDADTRQVTKSELFGGDTIRSFVLALLIGMVSGTYSSIFFASMLLVDWEAGALGRGPVRRRIAVEAMS